MLEAVCLPHLVSTGAVSEGSFQQEDRRRAMHFLRGMNPILREALSAWQQVLPDGAIRTGDWAARFSRKQPLGERNEDLLGQAA